MRRFPSFAALVALPVGLAALIAAPFGLAAQSPTSTPSALLDRAITRMGGNAALEAIRSLRMDVLTQWLRTSFADHPFADLPTYERNVELRDYSAKAWRNTRYFSPTSLTAAVVDVVRDTIAARLMPRAPGASPAWGPLNVAYVEERRELFAFAPGQLLRALRADPAARLLPDTILDGLSHARIAATVEGWPAVLFLRRADDLPAMVRFLANETNDFGLAPWGTHEVEFWYSGWTRVPGGALLPRQHDVRRVGRPYKRMTALALVVNAPAPADSFAISDSVAADYLATDRQPMWRTPLDQTARLERENFVVLPPMVGSPGAVRIGGKWLMIETAQAVGAMELVASWFERRGHGAIAGALVTNVGTSNGGAPWFLARKLPVLAAPGAERALSVITGSRRGGSGVTLVPSARWTHVGGDSLWLEPVSAPDYLGTMAVYSPTLRWLWLPFAGSPTHEPDLQAAIHRLEARGLAVALVGGPRGIVAPRRP